MKFKSRMKVLLIGSSAFFILLALGLSSDVLDLVREREQKSQKVYTTGRLNVSLPELTSSGAASANLLSVLEAEESDEEIEELKAALAGAEVAERNIEFKLVTSDLVDSKKQTEFLERSRELVFTGLEYQGRKLLQHEASETEETNTLLNNLRSALAENTAPWALIVKVQESATALFDLLKKQGPIYTINDAGVVQLVDAEADFVQALSDNFSTVALLTSEFYSQLQIGNSLEHANQYLQGALLELDRQEGGNLHFNLLREFQPDVDSKDYFVAVGWNENNRFRLVRMVPVYLSDLDERVELCDNGVDDNSNSLVDCDDPGCGSDPNCMHVDPELDCSNGIDDDSNGFTDCDDSFCQSMGVCAPPTDAPTQQPTEVPTATPYVPSYETSCDDYTDNDLDGATDCGDSECYGHWNCYWNPPLDCSTGAPLCADGTPCSDGYDAGGWCYYPCANCNSVNWPPAPPVISNPQPGWNINTCDGGFEVLGYAEGADYVEIYIDGSYAGSSGVYGGQWQTWVYPSSGTRSIYAVAYSYTNGQSDNSSEFQFYYEQNCEPPFYPAEFLGLSESTPLSVNCSTGTVLVPVQVHDYLESLALTYEGGELARLGNVYSGEQSLEVYLPSPMVVHLTLSSYAYGNAASRDQAVYIQNECITDPVCGNSSVESGEECDDGNKTDGDGCSSGCMLETVSTVNPTTAPTVNPTVAPTVNPTVAPTDSPTNSPTTEPTPDNKCGNGKVEGDEQCESPVENGWCDAKCWIHCDAGYVARKTIWPFDGNKYVCSAYSVNACGDDLYTCSADHPFDYNYRPPYGTVSWKCGSTICYPRVSTASTDFTGTDESQVAVAAGDVPNEVDSDTGNAATSEPTPAENPCAELYEAYGNNQVASENYERIAKDAQQAQEELQQDILEELSKPFTTLEALAEEQAKVAELQSLYNRAMELQDHMSQLARSYDRQKQEAEAAIDECEKAKREARAATTAN
jgi:cysteine-rich repeat protein